MQGEVFQILDDHMIGIDYHGSNSILYKNSVVADLDTNVFKRPIRVFPFRKNSVYYFQYKDGGYPTLDMNQCGPSTSITIISSSPNPYTNNK